MNTFCPRSDAAPLARASATWRLNVGDVVQIMLPEHRFCHEAPHFQCERGRTGRIIRTLPVESAPSHPYLVMLDRPDPSPGLARLDVAIPARHYAAEELRPLV
jgi:hypothetical protein